MKLKNFTKTRFWVRLGQPNVIGRNLLFVAVGAVALLSFAFDAVRLQNYSIMWVPLNLAGAIIVLAVAIPVLLLKRSLNELGRNQPIFNLIFAGLCLGFKNLLILVLAPLFGIADSGIPAVRFLGGFLIGIAILILYTSIVGSRIARVNSLNELRSIEIELKRFREAAFEELKDDSKIAAQNAAVTLIPQLEALKGLLKESEDLIQYADRLSRFVTQEIKPFGEKLSIEAYKLATAADHIAAPKDYQEEIKLNPADAIRLWLAFIPVPFSIYLLSTFALPVLTIADAVVASSAFGLTLLLCKLALMRFRQLSISETFVAITLVAFIASVPSYLLLAGVPNTGGVPELLPTLLIIPAWSVLASSMAYILDLWQSSTQDKLTLRIQELARENKLYEQKAWLARHGWYLVLHGVVQPALTSASIRASSADTFTAETNAQIEADLQRALDALAQNTSAKIEIGLEITVIQELWKGICEVEITFSEPALQAVEKLDTASLVLNEVLKEVVSNAVRHGSASKALIEIGLDSYGDIKIVAANDGKKPLGNIVESLGSRMLDAVSIERSLLWNEESNYTEFIATIPLDHK